MAASDVVVSLRAPTMGETSGSAIRALSLGRPLVVSDVGWFAELPETIALRVPVDERETDVLAATLELLARREDVRASMSLAARDHVAREHALDRVADLYAAALEDAAGGPAVRDALLGDVAAAAAEVGIEAGSEEAAAIGERLREARVGD
jgi:glycosyltransferase involved in cell wall biosynthesis